MEIELKNTVFKFNNISIKDNSKGLLKNKYIIINNSKYNNFLFEKNIQYNKFVSILKNSLDVYIDTNNYEDVLEECFNYFKITTNQLVKRNMSQKIGYIVIKSVENNLENIIFKLQKILNEYLNKNKSSFSDCDELAFLKIIANLNSVEKVDLDIFSPDDDRFSLLDFILDNE